MKKFLITGGILFAIMPAMALDLTDMYIPEDTGDCSGTEFQNNSVTMQAIYVTDSCPAGQYFNVGANATVDSTTGQITDASCQPCTNGHYCPSSTSITVNSNGILESQGAQECLAGTYADSDRTSLTACDACPAGTYQTQTGQSSCTQARQGYYIADATQVDVECPVGYRNGAVGTGTSEAACEKVVDCSNACSNFNNVITAEDNPDDPTKICSASINTNNNNIINGAITYGNRSTEPLCIVNKTCKPGYSPTNVYRWIVKNDGKNSERIVSYSNCSIDGQHGTSCNTMTPGTLVWRTDVNDTSAPFAELHLVAKCSALSPANNGYHTADNAEGFNTPGQYCWLKVIDFPGQEWMIGGPGGQDQAECEANCGVTMASATYPFGDINSQTNKYEVNPNALVSLSVMAGLTENGSTADVCVASDVTINWGKDSESQDITTTCVYDSEEGFTAPTTTPVAPADGLKFIGWRISPANNNN